MCKYTFVAILLLWCSALCAQQRANQDVRAGNKLYQKEKYTDAEVQYRKGLEKEKTSFEGHFNLGDALFKQEKYPEAMEQFEAAGALLKDGDKDKMAAVMHNVGNALFAQQKYQESIEAYKQALRNNPKDDDTRYNLAYAQKMLQNQQNQQNQDKQNKQDKDQQKQNQQNQSQEQNEQNQPQNQQPQEPKMSKENAEQILEALLQDEKETQEKAKRTQMKSTRSANKDW